DVMEVGQDKVDLCLSQDMEEEEAIKILIIDGNPNRNESICPKCKNVEDIPPNDVAYITC
ncbi:unnamed protein product, partial [Didymodactylos carnosus]